MKINCHTITVRLLHWIKLNCNCKLWTYASLIPLNYSTQIIPRWHCTIYEAFFPTDSHTWDLFVELQVTAPWWTALFNCWSSVLICQIISSQTYCTHLQLPAGWAFIQLWTVLLNTAMLCLGARVLHIWMSDTFMQWSVSLDSNDYSLMDWQVDDR